MGNIYRFRVEGHLDHDWSTWLDGVKITHEPDGTSNLQGMIKDQAALYGLIFRLQDLGVSLIAVQRLSLADQEPEYF